VRHRACAALIEDGQILMVRIETQNQSFWTLPGGRLNEGETFEQAVVREVVEEVRLNVRVIRPLYRKTDSSGKEVCFLVERVDAAAPLLGHNPERPLDQQILSGMDWRSLAEMKQDVQISEILIALEKPSSLLL